MPRREVRQRGGSDCAIAAIANAVGVSYRMVKTLYGRISDGLDSEDIYWLLSRFGECHEIEPRRRPKMSEWLKRHQTGRFVVSFITGIDIMNLAYDLHAVAVVDGRIMGVYHEGWLICSYHRIELEDRS